MLQHCLVSGFDIHTDCTWLDWYISEEVLCHGNSSFVYDLYLIKYIILRDKIRIVPTSVPMFRSSMISRLEVFSLSKMAGNSEVVHENNVDNGLIVCGNFHSRYQISYPAPPLRVTFPGQLDANRFKFNRIYVMPWVLGKWEILVLRVGIQHLWKSRQFSNHYITETPCYHHPILAHLSICFSPERSGQITTIYI